MWKERERKIGREVEGRTEERREIDRGGREGRKGERGRE